MEGNYLPLCDQMIYFYFVAIHSYWDCACHIYIHNQMIDFYFVGVHSSIGDCARCRDGVIVVPVHTYAGCHGMVYELVSNFHFHHSVVCNERNKP
jgi:hypothetical protein